jgi:hypothetical protein
MAKNTAQKGGLRGFIAPSEKDLYKAHKAEELEKFAERFEQLTGVHSVGRGLWADDSGRLWQHDSSFESHNPERDAFTVGPDLEAVWFKRPKGGPETVEQLEVQQARQAAAAEQQERERQARLREARKLALPVTLGHFDTTCRMTLVEAGRRVLDAGGKLEVRGGRLVVSLPPGATGGMGNVLAAARVLYTAETVVAEHLARKEPLPDAEVTPAGALV